MKTSIIVATMNRTPELALMLPTLAAQSCPAAEIIVVDKSSDSSTKDLVERFAADQPGCKVTYIYNAEARGAGGARNVGIEYSSGEVLVFLDDDDLLERDFLEAMLAVYHANAALGGVSGVVTNYSRPGVVQRFVRRLFWTGPFHDARQPIYWYADRLRDHSPIPVRQFAANVMSFRRAALGTARFPQGGGPGFPVPEDLDLSWRISEHFPLVMTPRARLVHLRTDSGRSTKHWLWSDAQGYYYMYERNWKTSWINMLRFVWLNVGYAVIATIASVRRFSIEPWRLLIDGARRGFQVAREEGQRS